VEQRRALRDCCWQCQKIDFHNICCVYYRNDYSTKMELQIPHFTDDLIHYVLFHCDPLIIISKRIVSKRWFEISCAIHLWKQVHDKLYDLRQSNMPYERLVCDKTLLLKNMTPNDQISWAIKNGNNVLFKRLFSQMDNLNLTDLLHETVHNNNIECLDMILEHKPNPYKGQICPLCIACGNGHIDICKRLVSFGMDIEFKGNGNATPMFFATENGHFEVVEWLYDIGANINARADLNLTSLYLAVQENHIDIVKFFLKDPMINLEIKFADNHTPLHTSSLKGFEECTSMLIVAGASINSQDKMGITPLGLSCTKKHLNIAKILIGNGAGINHRDHVGRTPLYLAAIKGNVDIVEYLYDNEADIDTRCNLGSTPLYVAAQSNYVDVINFILIKSKRSLNVTYKNQYTPLRVASQNNKPESVQALILAGADINTQDDGDATPLWIACQNGFLSITQILLKHGADPAIVMSSGYSCLFVASQNGYYEIVKLLCSYDVTNINTCIKHTPLMIATINGHVKCVELLLKYGARQSIVCNDGYSCLHMACTKKHLNIVKILLDNDISSLNDKTKTGCTPLALAIGNVEIIECLKKHGAI
jgi:ankyrin repeat domain-containing protein 50